MNHNATCGVSACGDDMWYVPSPFNMNDHVGGMFKWHLPSPFNMGDHMGGMCMCVHAMFNTYGDDMDARRK